MQARSLVVASMLLLVLAAASSSSDDRAPADDLSGPPFVSCKSWAVADGCNGTLLWGHEADTPRKSASTTKIMCAYVVLQLAQSQPGVLDEVVTFSKLADETPGSTAAVREGESLPVRECLYGLLLPSGNDAGNALAEHFNDRLSPPEYSDERTNPATPESHPTRANFIAEMNRAAKRLGLRNTFYRSPYGDGGTADDRTTTARDLLRLAWNAMQDPLFRRYVSTTEYATTVDTPDGGTRPVEWKNSNQLLGISGYDGVKTGTTTQAGACLVSSAQRGNDRLLVVVLGSTSTDGRYVDSKNLYRWAWLRRGHCAQSECVVPCCRRR